MLGTIEEHVFGLDETVLLKLAAVSRQQFRVGNTCNG